MRPRDRFDIVHALGLLFVVVALVAVFLVEWPVAGGAHPSSALDQALEKQLAYQAKVDFIRRIYAPVDEFRQAGRDPQALLKLEEISRDYPGEPHGQLLKGEILFQQGALVEALRSLVAAVKGNGDYIDRNSPLQRRELIDQVVAAGQGMLQDKARMQPENRSLQLALSDVHYLQSRLAGGCE